MQDRLEGVPAALVSASFDGRAVALTALEALYPLEAIYGASYTFIDRCYVFIDKPEPDRYRVTLTPKQAEGDVAQVLRAHIGEFANELLACAWRAQISKENRAVIEAVTMQAVGAAMGPPSLDDLAAFDFTDEAFEDPLGIAMSWEEKYKKKGKADGETDAAADAKAGEGGA
jgi:His-Xaa-Ser system protein HxsD